jgi:hypothetical protein
MRKYLLLFIICMAGRLHAVAQNIRFEDGTTVHVNDASFSYENIRRASAGFVINLDGLAGAKFFTVSYLQPEKFHIAANIGFAGASLESTIFFSGKTKERQKSFALKYASAGYNTVKVYTLKQAVEKRKELGVYLAINDYGHLWQDNQGGVDNYSFKKQTQFYAGIAAVNYWHSSINFDDNFMKRGQFVGRTILAPYIGFGSVPDTLGYTINDVPKYGVRLMYELSNTFGLMGAKIRGRTNMLIRTGVDLATDKNKNFYTMIIFGFGIVYNFAEGPH